MFSDRANFSGITKSEHLEVSRAIQKVFIDVNEKGSEAAAATGKEFFFLPSVCYFL